MEKKLYRPIDIARGLGISTSLLRYYEGLGLVPQAPRSAAGYRLYTDEHAAYFACVRGMMPGFTLEQIGTIHGAAMRGDIDGALWTATEIQAKLVAEQRIAKNITIKLPHAHTSMDTCKTLTIGAVSRETGVPLTMLRHWDSIGLITSARDPHSRYRLYSPADTMRVLAIAAIRFSLYDEYKTHFLDQLRPILDAFDFTDTASILSLADTASRYLNRTNRARVAGIAALHRLCQQAESGVFAPSFTECRT